MNLYLLTHPKDPIYPTRPMALVVAAETEEAADLIDSWVWFRPHASHHGPEATERPVTIKLIGTAVADVRGVVCASFNAG